MKSKIFSSKYVKTTSKGQLWIPAFVFLGFLMAFPVAELVMMGNWSGMNYKAAQIERLYEHLWRDGFMLTGFAVAFGAAFLNGVNSFWYVYSSRKVDLYHSLPIKRSQMFWHKLYVGLLYYLIPYLAMEFLAVCIGAMRGFFSLKLMGMALGMLVLHLLLYLFVYFGVVLMLVITGNILMGGLMELFLLFYGPILDIILVFYQEHFFSSYYNGEGTGLLYYCSPITLGLEFIRAYEDGNWVVQFLTVLGVTIALGVSAYFAYIKRTSESTGRPMVYTGCAIFVKAVVVAALGLGTGMIFYMMTEGEAKLLWWIFGLVIGTFLSHGVMEVIYQMDFRKFFKHKMQFVFTGMVVAFLAFAFWKDLFGFDSFFPAYDKLENFHIDLLTENEEVPFLEQKKDGKYKISYQWENTWDQIPVINEAKESIYHTLEQIVKKQDTMQETLNRIPVGYQMKSGRMVYREYKVSSEDLKKLLCAYYQDEKLKEEKYAFLELDSKYLQWLNGSFQNGEYYTLFQDKPEKYEELLEALKQDVRDASPEELVGQPCASLNFLYENIPMEQGELLMDETGSCSGQIYVFPTFTRTVKVLEETGYPLSMDDIKINSIKITCYENPENATETQEEQVYKKPEEINALREALIPISLRTTWLDFVENTDATMTVEGSVNEVYVSLLKEKLPEFIKP